MKFTISRSSFTAQLNDVSRAISSKATIPILTGIKITASNEGLTLIGSDSEISIESFIPIEDDSYQLNIEETGSIVVTARLFNDIIRKLPTSEVTIETNQQFVVTVSSGNAVFELNGADGAAYPRLPEVESNQQIKLPTSLFKELINQTIFSASNQESRPILTGINLRIKEGYLIGVATDSHRLSHREIPVETNPMLESLPSITIPKKTLLELSRIVQDDQTIELIISKKQIIFVIDHLTIYSRLLEGNYPETDRLIPESYQTEMIVNAEEFLQAIERASLMSHQDKNNVVRLNIVDNVVNLSVLGSSIGSANEAIPTQSVTGDDLQISFNPDFMKDALRAFNGVDVKIQFQTSIRPLLLSAVEESEVAHNKLLQLLTPRRTH